MCSGVFRFGNMYCKLCIFLWHKFSQSRAKDKTLITQVSYYLFLVLKKSIICNACILCWVFSLPVVWVQQQQQLLFSKPKSWSQSCSHLVLLLCQVSIFGPVLQWLIHLDFRVQRIKWQSILSENLEAERGRRRKDKKNKDYKV